MPVGLLACALLVINNLRDIPTDKVTGKRTLAVVLGDQRTRLLYAVCVAAAVRAWRRRSRRGAPLALIALVAVPLAVPPVRLVRDGATGPRLIAALGQTGRLQLAFGAAADHRPRDPALTPRAAARGRGGGADVGGAALGRRARWAAGRP